MFENGLRDRTFLEDESTYSELGVASLNISDEQAIADVCLLSGYRMELKESRRLAEYLQPIFP